MSLLVLCRLRVIGQKARLMDLDEETKRGEAWRQRALAVEREVQATRHKIEHLQREQPWLKEYNPEVCSGTGTGACLGTAHGLLYRMCRAWMSDDHHKWICFG